MENWLTLSVFLTGILIFCLRVFDMTLDTVRVLLVVRGKKLPVWVLGVLQSTLYILAISKVLSNANNPVTVLFYSCGFATGNILGIMLEERMAIGFKQVTVISRERGPEIADCLRSEGFGVTEVLGKGLSGDVEIVHCFVKRRQVAHIERLVSALDENVLITTDDFLPINRGGFWRK